MIERLVALLERFVESLDEAYEDGLISIPTDTIDALSDARALLEEIHAA